MKNLILILLIPFFGIKSFAFNLSIEGGSAQLLTVISESGTDLGDLIVCKRVQVESRDAGITKSVCKLTVDNVTF